MANDDQILELLRDRFDKVDKDLSKLADDLSDHYEKDERYWGMIDEQQAQLKLIKRVAAGGGGAALFTWLATKFGIGLK